MLGSLTNKQAAELARRTEEENQKGPLIKSATYADGVFTFLLTGAALEGVELRIPAASLAGLNTSTEKVRADFIVTFGGASIRWPEANVGFVTPQLVERAVGVKSLSGHQSQAGKVTSEAKAASSVVNGKKGGRPRKTPVAA